MKKECCENCGFSMSYVGKHSIECWRWVYAGGEEIRPAEEVVHRDHHCNEWKPMPPEMEEARRAWETVRDK